MSIQWQETISDAYLTYTPLCFPFIEPNISLLPQGSLTSIPSNTLILCKYAPQFRPLVFYSINFQIKKSKSDDNPFESGIRRE